MEKHKITGTYVVSMVVDDVPDDIHAALTDRFLYLEKMGDLLWDYHISTLRKECDKDGNCWVEES